MRKFSIVLLAIIAISFVGCKKEKLITLSTTATTLHHGETYQISAQCDNPITYTSSNEYYAKVSSLGKITAQYVGKTTIRLKSEDDTRTFTVNVAPKSNLYPEPNIKFGESKSSVISKYGTPTTTNSGIGYNDYSPNAPILLVTLDNNDCVTSYGLAVKSAFTSELSDFLGERYEIIGYDDDVFYYRNGLNASSSTMAVALTLYNVSYWLVAYMPYDNRGEIDKTDMDALLKTLE